MGEKTTSTWRCMRFALLVAVLLLGPGPVLGDVCDDQFIPPDRILYLTDDFNGGTIYTYDVELGIIVASFPTPEANVGLGQGLAYSQRRCTLYYTNGTGPEPTLYELDSLTGEVLNSADVLADLGYPVMGLGVGQIGSINWAPFGGGDTFLLSMPEDRGDGFSQILFHDPDTLASISGAGAGLGGTALGQAALAADEDSSIEPFTNGIAYFTRNRTVDQTSDNRLDAISWDPFGIEGQRFPTPAGAAGADQIGLAFDGRTLYMSRASTDGLFVYNLVNYFSAFATPILEDAFVADPTPGGPITGVAGGLADSDCDGVINSGDNCVCDGNPLQEDFNGDGVGDACTPCDPDPRTQGYWHRQCLGVPAGEGGIDPGRNGRGPQGSLEPDFVKVLMDPVSDLIADLMFENGGSCANGMNADPASDPCEKALKQTTAMLFNLASSKLSGSCEVNLSAEGCGSGNLLELVNELAGLINSGDPDNCQKAADCAAAVNEGTALVESLVIQATETQVPLNANLRKLDWRVSTGHGTSTSSDRDAEDVTEEVTAPLTPVVPVSIATVPTAAEAQETRDVPTVKDEPVTLQRHLAVLGNPAAPEKARVASRDALLTVLSGGYEVEVRLEVAEALVGQVDAAFHSLLVAHLEDIRREASDFGLEDSAKRAERLLDRLGAGGEE